MFDNPFIDDELKKIILSDDELKEYFIIYLFYQIQKDENKDILTDFYLDDYTTFRYYLDTDGYIDTLNSLSEVLKDSINNEMIDRVTQEYGKLQINETKQVIYALSRLLYLQDKYKDDKLGKIIDDKIKNYLGYVREIEKDKTQYSQEKFKSLTEDKKASLLEKLTTHLYYTEIKAINYDIAYLKLDNLMYWINEYKMKTDETQAYIKALLDNIIGIATKRLTISQKISAIVNDTEMDLKMANFFENRKEETDRIKEKYNAIIEDDGTITIDEDKREAYLDELSNAFDKYDSENGFNLYDKEDVINWHNKADVFINHLINYDNPNSEIFTMDYTLDYLAYNDYQRKAYKLNISDKKEDKKEKKKLTERELKEKYKDITQLNGEKLEYNRQFARVDTSKVNSNVYDLRESIVKKVHSKLNITRNKIDQLNKKTKKTKEDLDELNELYLLLSEQEQEQKRLIEETNDLKADIDLLTQQIGQTTDANEIKRLTRKLKDMQKQYKEKTDTLNNEGIYLQGDLLNNQLLVAEKINPKTKESYKLMISNDYDIQNFNSEGRNFLYYIPNIHNVTDELNQDFITIDIKDYLNFTGRPTGNISRIRKNLQNTLKEMSKERYDYTYLDEKGVLHDDSLVLIGDIKGTEYKGKASVKVQLGATFKDNLKQAFIKNQYVQVNSDIFKIGKSNNLAENRAREIFLYLAKLCRIEAKNQVNGGEWRKDIHLETIINKLIELNLLNYNKSRYNESVKEPLLYALNTGMELGYFTYETDAFKYYDDVIATNNNGANVQDKITNFEKGDKYGIRFTINGNMVNLESNTKAHKTYEEHKKKKTTKK